MNKVIKLICVLLVTICPTLQVAANESEAEQFKQQLLTELMAEIKELEPAEIRKIINEVECTLDEGHSELAELMSNASYECISEQTEQNLKADIEHYENTPQEQLLTKTEAYLQMHRGEVAPRTLSMLQSQSGKSEEQLILEELNPRLKMLSDEDYYYDEETGEIEFTLSKDRMFYIQEDTMTQGLPWEYLAKGDVFINLDNGSSSGLFKWGHAGMLYSKGRDAKNSWSIEAPGGDERVKLVNFNTVWHSNNKDRITYNYVPAAYKTWRPSFAANEAKKYEGRPYGFNHALGTSWEIYCTELVYLAYLSQGIDLGNGVKKGDPWILMPKRMYCDADLMYYYRQNMGGGMC
jgi:uncharacterized protein YycO